MQSSCNYAVYITPTPDVPGEDYLVPRPTIALWFQKDIGAATMMELDTTYTYQADFTSQQVQSVTYTNDYAWAPPVQPADYKFIAPAITGEKDVKKH
jgi:hypothetical protein